MKIALAAALLLGSLPVNADEYQPGYSASRTCVKTEYREEYVPGTQDNPGYVKSWSEQVEVPCEPWQRSRYPSDRPSYRRHVTVYEDTNDCSDGAVLGGIAGGGAGAALSRGEGRWWAIPLGIVAGSMIGCDIDGG